LVTPRLRAVPGAGLEEIDAAATQPIASDVRSPLDRGSALPVRAHGVVLVCFSPQADLVGGIVVGAIGIDVVRHVPGWHDHKMLASLPLLFAAHQLDEAVGWWTLQGHVGHTPGRVAVWGYLLFAFVVLPVFVPVAVLLIEPAGRRRWIVAPFVALGAVVSGTLLLDMLRGPISASLGHYHISYSTHPSAGGLIVALYVVATCGSLLFSGYRDIAIFGLVNLIVVAVLAQVTIDGFASLWCGWAAIASGAMALHLRLAQPHPRVLAAPATGSTPAP
jgi:hypothetical protein